MKAANRSRLEIAHLWTYLSSIISSRLFALALLGAVYYFVFLPSNAPAGFIGAIYIGAWGLFYASSASAALILAAYYGAVGLCWRVAARINVQILLAAWGLSLALEGWTYMLGHLLWVAAFWVLLVCFPSGVGRATKERSASDD